MRDKHGLPSFFSRPQSHRKPLERAVETHQCETVEELQNVIAAEWDKVDKGLMLELAHSMPKSCQAIIDAQGWHTKY